jgi:hypothetical protein
MNQNIMSQLPGGTIYNTVYPAGENQDSSAGTTDIINHITTTLQTNPNECFILEGYSQGAAATVNALVQLTRTAMVEPLLATTTVLRNLMALTAFPRGSSLDP